MVGMPHHALGTCLLCEATCGISVEVDGGRPVSVRGDARDPMSQGFVCPKVVGMIDLHEDPDRLRRPVVRTGKDFREVSWDEALERAADGLARVRRRHGKDAVAVYQGNPTAHNLGLLTMGQMVARTLGTKNLYSASTADQVPHMLAAHEMFGHLLFMPVPDVDRTRHWLIVGGNPLVSNGSIMTAPDVKRRIEAIQARGGTVTVVDPRRTETARAADRHVFLRPASDPWLFLAMIHVVFDERLDRPGPHVTGVDDLRSLSRPFTPEAVAGVTGVAPDVLRDLTRSFAKAERAACYVRLGTCHQEHGTLASWLAYALAAVTGNLDREGGLMWTRPAVDVVAIADAFGLAGHGRFKSRVRGFPEAGGELPVAVMAEEIETPGPGRIRALITSAGNPVLSAPNGRRVDRALASLEHMVSVDGYINETTRHAHVILPPCSQLEREHYDLALAAFGVRNFAKWVDPPLRRDRDSKDDGEIFAELGLRLRLGAGSRGPRAALRDAIAKVGRKLGARGIVDLGLRIGPYGLRGRGDVRGLSLARLRERPHGIDLGPLVPMLPGMLRTASKKVELAPPLFAREVAALRGALDKTAPSELALIGRRELRSNNSWLHNSARLVKGSGRGVLLVNPADASRRGLVDGGRARVATRLGDLVCTIKVSDEIMQGVVSLPHGWGHDRPNTRARVAAAHAGVSLNDVTDDERMDRLTGNAAFSGIPVEVTAVTVATAHAE